MNQILAGIYGTHGHEKVAAEGMGQPITTLSDLAEALVLDGMEEGADLEKVASAHNSVLEDLAFYDLSGRAAAQAEFTEMEKMAAAGDLSALEAFFEDEVESAEDEAASETALAKQAILAELQRRASN